MYECQNGGFISAPPTKIERLPSKVTVEERFDEAGRIVSRTTTTEYEKTPRHPFAYTANITNIDAPKIT